MSGSEFSDPKNVAPPVGPYSHLAWIKAGSDIVFLSGQVGVAPDGSLASILAGQADQAFRNLIALLESCGLTPQHLVKATIFLVAGQDASVVRAARVKHFVEARPAMTFVYVPQLADPKYLIEVEGVACR